jgi:hypothetical protein
MKTIKIEMPKISLLEKATHVDRELKEMDEGGVYEQIDTTHSYRIVEFENEEELELDIRDRIENPRADYDYSIDVLQIVIDGEEIDATEYWERLDKEIYNKKEVKE